MLGMMPGGERVRVESAGAVALDELMATGVHGQPHIDALAARSAHEIATLIWNYHDDDMPAPPTPVSLTIAGIPVATGRVLVRHYRIDEEHSNAYAAWLRMGSPEQPSAEQYARLEAAGQLELLDSPEWVSTQDGRLSLSFALRRRGISLVKPIGKRPTPGCPIRVEAMAAAKVDAFPSAEATARRQPICSACLGTWARSQLSPRALLQIGR